MIKKWLTRLAIRSIGKNIFLEVDDFKKMDITQQRAKGAEAAALLLSPLLVSELNRIHNQASYRIIRKTDHPNEIAYNRGIIYAVEYLKKRLKKLESINK